MASYSGSSHKTKAENDQLRKGAPDDAVEEEEKTYKYPKAVAFIIGNEFCERFTYYGTRAVLSIYLVGWLNYTESDAALIFHAFSMLCYFFPLAGAIIADSCIGKFKTIFYLSVVYVAGNATISAGSSPLFGNSYHRTVSLLGLLLIAIGTGGIKPCVAAFGGDQFVLPQQVKQLASFFSIFYASINAGSLLSTVITPILRHDVHCFGDHACFPLAFGVPGVLMLVALLLFLAGKPLYVCKEPRGNILVKVFKVVSHALAMKFRSKEKKGHWLDHADDKYDKTLIAHCKAALQVLVLFIPLPIFWSLFDQQGSRWTFQATHMDGRLGFYTIKPDQMQVINPLLILVFIPIFDYGIYPFFAKIHLLKRPLQRIATGGLLSALSFVMSAFIELKLQPTYPNLPPSGTGQLRVFNGLECEVTMTSFLESAHGSILSLDALQVDASISGSEDSTLQFTTTAGCTKFPNKKFSVNVLLQETESVSVFLSSSSNNPTASQMAGVDSLEKLKSGYPQLRVLYNLFPFQEELKLSQGEFSQTLTLKENSTYTSLHPILKTGKFTVTLDGSVVTSDLELETAGVYTLILHSDNTRTMAGLVTVTRPNTVHMLWLVPQYVIITAGEVMFSITGLGFSYTQAPESMKSLIASAWLLTVSFGNLFVVLVLHSKVITNQVWEFLFFATMMVLDMSVFIFLSYFYKYKTSQELEEVAEEHADSPPTAAPDTEET